MTTSIPRATKRVLAVIAVSVLIAQLKHALAGSFPCSGLVSAMSIGFDVQEKREKTTHKLSAKLATLRVLAKSILFSMAGVKANIDIAWWAGGLGAAFICLRFLAQHYTRPGWTHPREN